METLLNKCTNPSAEYRSKPFWSWNGDLDEEVLREQIKQMDEAGLGGFFMHARAGLKTGYMSEIWMDRIAACIDEAKIRGMEAWCYDEEGWPSGFAGGAIPTMNEAYQMHYIVLEEVRPEQKGRESEALTVQTIDEKAWGVYVRRNAGYIDILNRQVVKAFLDHTYAHYYDRFGSEFGKTMKGFFTDEPQYSRGLMPWSPTLPSLFKEKFGYDMLPKLPLLFKEGKESGKFRYDYWSLVTDLYQTSFGKQIYEWCELHNCQLTGHTIQEDNLFWQMKCSGGVMPFYEHMQMPGMDWLGRGIHSPLIPKQVSSAADQLGRTFVLSETFAGCGWDISLEELKWIAEWQFVNGINTLCQHLQSYSLEGKRKRDYPPSLFIQQPWWQMYHHFNDYFARLSALLTSGHRVIDVLVLHPIKSAWMAYDLTNNQKMQALDQDLNQLIKALSDLHIDWHFGDETIMKNHGSVQDRKIIVGKHKYQMVILPSMDTIDLHTLSLLEVFTSKMGCVISAGNFPRHCEGVRSKRLEALKNKVMHVGIDKNELSAAIEKSNVRRISIVNEGGEAQDIHYQLRKDGDQEILYLVNLNQRARQDVVITLKGSHSVYALTIEDMSLMHMPVAVNQDVTTFHLTFNPMASHVLILNQQEKDILNRANDLISEKEAVTLVPSNEWAITSAEDNALTLDFCDYRIDDNEWVEKVPVIEVMRLLLERQQDCKIQMRFNFQIDKDPLIFDNLSLVLEGREATEIHINGIRVEDESNGWWLDRSFERVDIQNMVKAGYNEILLTRTFHQDPKVYDLLFGEDVLESELNKLTLDTELESIYVVGDFGVVSQTDFTARPERPLYCPFTVDDTPAYLVEDKKEQFTAGPFYITELPSKVSGDQLISEGFPFFAGSLSLAQMLTISKEENLRYYIEFQKIDAASAQVSINGKSAGFIGWRPYRVEVTDLLINGSNEITVTLFGSNRNLLGPHHNNNGMTFMINPKSFSQDKDWTDQYCFVKFGIR